MNHKENTGSQWQTLNLKGKCFSPLAVQNRCNCFQTRNDQTNNKLVATISAQVSSMSTDQRSFVPSFCVTNKWNQKQ